MILTKFLIPLFNKSPRFWSPALILLFPQVIKKNVLCTLNSRSPVSPLNTFLPMRLIVKFCYSSFMIP